MQSARFVMFGSSLALRLALCTSLLVGLSVCPARGDKEDAGGFLHQIELSNFPSINLFVSCLDEEAGLIPDVGEYNFQIEVEGKPAAIEGMALIRDLTPAPDNRAHIALIIDNAADQDFDLALLRQSAEAVIDQLGDGDDMMIVASDSAGAPLVLSWITPSRSLLREKLAGLYLSPRTRAYDMIGLGATQVLRQRAIGRRTVIVISSGDPRGRRFKFGDIKDIGRYGILPVAVVQLGGRRVDNNYLRLTEATFGTVFHTRDPEGLPALLGRLSDWLGGQYQIALELTGAELKAKNFSFQFKLNYLGEEYESEFEPRLHPDYAAYGNITRAKMDDRDRVEDYVNYLENFPKSRWADKINLDLARIYLDDGEVSDANQLLAQFKSAYPKSDLTDYADYLLGVAYRRIQQTVEAEESFNNVVTDYPDGDWADDALFALGELYGSNDEQNKAMASYLALVERYPASDLWDRATLELARLYLDRGETEAALERFMSLTARDVASQQTALAHYYLGKIYAEGGRLGEAREELESYFRYEGLGPERLDGLFILANLYYDSEMYRQAGPLLHQVAENPEAGELSPEAFFKGGLAYFNLQQWELAAEMMSDLRMAYPASPRAVEATDYLGLSVYYLNDWNQAAPLLEMGGDRSMDADAAIDFWIKSGSAYMNGERWEEAIAPLEKVVEGHPEHGRRPEAEEQLTKAYRMSGRPTGRMTAAGELPAPPAPETVQPLTGREQRQVSDIYREAMKAYESGDSDRAVGEFSRIITDYPASRLAENAYYWTGQIAYNNQDYATAARYFNATVENRLSQVKDDDALQMMGQSYYYSDDMKRALSSFYRLLIEYPGGEYERVAHRWATRIISRNPSLGRDPEIARQRRKLPPPPPLSRRQAANARQRIEPSLTSGNPEEVETAHLRLAEIEFQTEDYAAALKRLKSLTEAGTPTTQDRAAQYLSGRCYYRIGMDVQAGAAFNRLINDNPSDRYAARARRMLRRIEQGR